MYVGPSIADSLAKQGVEGVTLFILPVSRRTKVQIGTWIDHGKAPQSSSEDSQGALSSLG